MGFLSSNAKVTGVGFLVINLLSACVAEEDLIIPNKQQRTMAVETYKQCVSQATNRRITQNLDPEQIVRESIAQCRTSKYTMLKDYPKDWRASFEKQIDDELLKNEMAYIIEARQGR